MSGPAGSKQRAHYADLEMQSGTTGTSRRGPRDPNALTFLDHDADSEENILKNKGFEAGVGTRTTVVQSPRDVYGADKGGIKKTHVVSVDYDNRSERGGEEKRWHRGF